MRNIILFISLYWLCSPLRGQETFGALHSNYSPANSVHLNPSSMLDAKTWLDIHIAGAGAYVNNDIVAGNNTTLIRMTSGFGEDDLKYNTGRSRYHAYNRNFAQVLSGVWSQGNHAVGLSFGASAFTDARRINGAVVSFIENGITNNTEQHQADFRLNRFRANALAYGEAKISYAHTFLKRRRDMFMAGISYKKIFPIVGGGASIRRLAYNVYNDTVLHLYEFIGDAGVNVQPEFSLRGGWGIDLGFTYQYMYSGCESYYPNSRKGGCNRVYYKYKIGVSITDLGYARFNPANVNYVGYGIGETDIIYYDQLSVEAGNFPAVLINQEPDPEQGVICKPHKMSLPTALSVQYDRNIIPAFFYLNATWIHGIPPTKGAFGPRRAHSLSFTPRIETKWFDAALPVSLYEYQRMQLGLSLRFYILTIGTDKLLNYFVPHDIYGADFYFHLKVPLFRNPKCKTRRPFGSDRKGGFGKKHPDCDAYR